MYFLTLFKQSFELLAYGLKFFSFRCQYGAFVVQWRWYRLQRNPEVAEK